MGFAGLFGSFFLAFTPVQLSAAPREADVIVVGAGIAGHSAALEAARRATVLVVDMRSIFGGHAVLSHGGLCVVGTPAREARGVVDTPRDRGAGLPHLGRGR